MPAIQIPKRLGDLLRDDPYEHPVRLLCDQVARIISPPAGGCPFFRHFTDHGPRHIEDVLESEVDLIPKEVWKESQPGAQGHRILTAADAAVLIGGTLLHDIAMHLHPAGFKELVSKTSHFRPIAWFDAPREGHPGDRPWHALWAEYEREARKLCDRQLTDIIGEEEARAWTFDGLPQSEGQWTKNDHLIVGEFIRRHHARLAHEIALYGFPGLTTHEFPAMGEESHRLSDIANLIGLVARSHGVSLRLCKEYLDSHSTYHGSPRPKGTAVLYPMALLRVADYLQIDKKRAPAVLLNLGKPQSPISIREWTSHQAVTAIELSNDPRARMIRVKPDIPLPLFLHLQDLISGIQKEIDHSTAVLDESYGLFSKLGLDKLGLAIRRVRSNLLDPELQNDLPYIPRRTSFSTDPNLLSLLVEPLYGKHPGVGVRELIQNAVDAVREGKAWNQTHPDPHATPETDDGWDVLVEFIHQPNGPWRLRVEDKGIGMSPDTLENYFLRAGASFRDSPDWRRDFVGDDGKPRLALSGRFGIGVFAAFLLGDSIQVQTRHAGSKGGSGHALEAAHNSQLIEIKRMSKSSVGTVVEIPIRTEAAEILGLDAVSEKDNVKLHSQVDWYCGTWPRLRMQVVKAGQSIELAQSHRLPSPDDDLPPEWSIIRPEGFDAVLWTFGDAPRFLCNGIRIADAGAHMSPIWDSWGKPFPLGAPCVWVSDNQFSLPLTITRYQLKGDLPFANQLEKEVLLSFIAHALICGPTTPGDALKQDYLHPLLSDWSNEDSSRAFFDDYPLTQQPKIWCCSSEHFVPLDPWLCRRVGADRIIFYGDLNCSGIGTASNSKAAWARVALARDQITHESNQWLSSAWLSRCLTPGTSYLSISHFDLVNAIRTSRNTDMQLEAVVASYSDHLEWKEKEAIEDYFDHWDLAGVNPGLRRRYKSIGNPKDPSITKLISTLKAVERALVASTIEGSQSQGNSIKTELWDTIDHLHAFIAVTQLRRDERPNSLFARTYDEVLGPRPIPFDPAARGALVEIGRQHIGLRAHIERWEEMKAANSKWVRGELLERNKIGLRASKRAIGAI